MHRSAFQTSTSLELTSLSENFRTALGALRLGPHGYIPDMTAPEGPSTGGGAQATQHLLLLPPEPDLSKLVVGRVNKHEGTAELRTWDYLDAVYRERFNEGVPVDPEPYAQFLESAQGFLAESGLRVSLSSALEAGGRGRSSGNTVGMVLILLGLLGILAAAILWLFVLKH